MCTHFTHKIIKCHFIFAPSASQNCFHTPNDMKSEMHIFNLLPRWLAFSVRSTESLIQAPTGDKNWLWASELWKQESSCLNMSALVIRMIESLSTFSSRGAPSALAEVYLSCLMCLDVSMRPLCRGSTVLSYHSFIWQQTSNNGTQVEMSQLTVHHCLARDGHDQICE